MRIGTEAWVGVTTGIIGSWEFGSGDRVGVKVGTTPFSSGQPHVTTKPLPSPTVSVPSLLLSPEEDREGGGLIMRCENPFQSRDLIPQDRRTRQQKEE